MPGAEKQVVVAGHICLDIIPELRHTNAGMTGMLLPGMLAEVGQAVVATGGAVSNTGIALHRLGTDVKLMGKVGADPFGEAILGILRRHDAGLSEGMIVAEGEHSSYSIVISPPGIDRIFLHHTGTNDTFTSADVTADDLENCGLLHFGYPPLMRQMYASGGDELRRLFSAAKKAGATTSLDLAMPDASSEAGRADWTSILSAVLPDVDIFLPSFEELLFMLDRPLYDELRSSGDSGVLPKADGELLGRLSGCLLDMGVAIAVIKLGEHGLYMRTTARQDRLTKMGCFKPEAEGWLGRELLAPCYKAAAVGTTGAGDCTIAGFLHGMIRGGKPHRILNGAAAVGACSVESADATSGVPEWPAVARRMETEWERMPHRLRLPVWTWDHKLQLWIGPNDGGRRGKE